MSKRSIKRIYAAQRREDKAIYINENGSVKGWKKSQGFKRIARNQNQTQRRYTVRVEKVRRKREIIKKGGEVGQEKIRVIAPWAVYHDNLGYGDSPRNVIRNQFKILTELGDKDTYLRVQAPNGTVRIYATMKEADTAIQALYQKALEVREKTGDNYGLLVAAVKGETENERFVNIYTVDISGKEGAFELPFLPESTI